MPHKEQRELFKTGQRRCIVCKEILFLENFTLYDKLYDSRCIKCSKNRRASMCGYKYGKKRLETIGYIYLLKCEGYYKIGVTKHKDIKKRLIKLQIGNPFNIILYKQYKTTVDMYTIEKDIHKKFRHKHIRGERFELVQEDLESIEKFFII